MRFIAMSYGCRMEDEEGRGREDGREFTTTLLRARPTACMMHNYYTEDGKSYRYGQFLREHFDSFGTQSALQQVE